MSRRLRRRRFAEEAAGGGYARSLVGLVLILLCIFILLASKAKIDPIKSSKAVESVKGHFPGLEAEIERQKRQVSKIVELAREGGFIAAEKGNTYLITLPDTTAFESGSDQIHPEAALRLQKIAEIVSTLGLVVDIEGYTDDKPIHTTRFPSNWELSAARAVAVLRLFNANGVLLSKLSASGRGEFVPVASNETEEGRAKNRRVELVIKAPASKLGAS